MSKTNIIKSVKEKYKLSYREMAQLTGIKESTLNSKASSKVELTDTITKPLELLIRVKELEEQVNDFEYLQTTFKRFVEKQ